ncbi:hypothetical protein [Pseudohalioglobus lutimaris]|uniref:Uncharacterized protein n=1 Tax=Pseudohalioglobus lutimaris TaxID=1737061 RepID=A0A2N5X823_9GAMM|nr:hypothetical protein [Pseudohalioglobus lutimaris]PLW70622.1 hypothetical protein C0039_00360 [Pseudohalioglobus lutimaris]
MQLSLTTYHRSKPHHPPTELGASTFVFEQRELRLLRRLSARLHKLNQSEMTVLLEPDAIDLKAPTSCGALRECGIRLTCGDEPGTGSFNFVGRRERDGGLVFTDRVSIGKLSTASTALQT